MFYNNLFCIKKDMHREKFNINKILFIYIKKLQISRCLFQKEIHILKKL